MDYGQNTKTTSDTELNITAGVGTAPESSNPLNQSENLNLEGFQSSSRNLGQTSLNSISIPAQDFPDLNATRRVVELREPEAGLTSTNDAERFGEIIDLSMPPLVTRNSDLQAPGGVPNKSSTAESPMSQSSATRTIQDDVAKHFADGKINNDDMAYIKTHEAKLSQNDNAEDFYQWWHQARSDALRNDMGTKA